MNGLPSFWTLMPGVVAGCFAVGRIGHWLQLVLVALGRDPAHPRTIVGPVQRGPLVLATVVHPVPWLLLLGVGFGIHRLFGGPIDPPWRWFFIGFVLGPLVFGTLLYFKVQQIRRRRLAGIPAPSLRKSRKRIIVTGPPSGPHP